MRGALARTAGSGLLLVALLSAVATAAQKGGGAVVRARDVALLLSGEEGGGLPMEVVADVRAEESAPDIRLVVELPAAPLLERPGPEPVGLTLVAYAVGTESRIVGSTVERLALDPERLAGSTAAGLRLFAGLPMPPEPVDLRVLVRVGAGGGGSFGLRSVPFHPPPGMVEGPAGTGDGWVAVAPIADSSSWLETNRIPGEPSRAALPTVAPGERLSIGLLSRSPPASPPRLQLVPTADGRDDSPPSSRWLEVQELVPSGPEDRPWRLYRGVVRLPAVEPGRYRLRLSGAVTTPELLVTDPAVAAFSWAELRTRRPVTASAPRAGTARARPGPTSRALREAIVSFADSGGVDPAPLSTLYRETWERAGTEGLMTLVDAVGKEGIRLRKRDPAALLPLVAAHGELYRAFLDRELWGLSSAARRATIILLDLFSTGPDESEDGMEVPRRSAGALGWCRLGDEVLESKLLDHAVAFYERAAGLSPNQTHALAMLGAVYERVGEYGKAEDAYRRLVAHEPNGERRLRLAIQYRRLERRRAARREFVALLERENPAWVDVVASQELADLDLEAGRHRSAVEILDRALDEHPGEESLLLHRAALSEISGDHREAVELLERLGPPEPEGISPRHRYALWPPEQVGEIEEPFEAAVAPTRERLLVAVEDLGWR